MLKKKYYVSFLIAILVLSMIILPLISAVVSAEVEPMLVFNFLEGMEENINPRTFYIKDITITGTAMENTEIFINIYWNKPINEKSIISKEKSYQGDYGSDNWILQESLSHTVGAMGTFAVPARINIGRYKIEAIAKTDKDIMSYEVEIEHKDKNEIAEELRSKMFKNLNLGVE